MISPLPPPRLSTAIEFFDSHCHFDFADFDGDRDAVWQACRALGVKQLLIPGVAPEQWRAAAQLSANCPGIYYAAGVHPWWIGELRERSDMPRRLREALADPQCVAVGECGLDAAIATPLVEQLPILDMHLQIASETSLPLIIHCRKAHRELLAALQRWPLPAGGVIHGFSGSLEIASSYWQLGFCLGIGGTITYPRAAKTRETVKALPLAAIVLETDAPDMPLQGGQGKRNSPANIPAVAQTLAELRGESVDRIARQTTANARRLFALPESL